MGLLRHRLLSVVAVEWTMRLYGSWSAVMAAGLLALSCGGAPTAPDKATTTAAARADGTASTQSSEFDQLMALVPPAMRARWDRATEAERQAARDRFEALPEATRARMLRAGHRWSTHSHTAIPASSDVAALNDPPDAVFRTTPPADSEGVVHGMSPLEVTFNMCPSTDPDPGDVLKFTYDFEGTGIRERGACRGTHLYTAAFGQPREFLATVCTSDRQPEDGHWVCKTFTVDVTGGERCVTITEGSHTFPNSNTYQSVFDGSFQSAGGEGVLLTLAADQNVGFALNGWDCGPGGYNLVYTFYGEGIYSWNDNVKVTADYGCSAYAGGEGSDGFFGGSGGSMSWSTEVCDPGAF